MKHFLEYTSKRTPDRHLPYKVCFIYHIDSRPSDRTWLTLSHWIDRMCSRWCVVQVAITKTYQCWACEKCHSKREDVDGFQVRTIKFDCCTPKGIIDWLYFNGYDVCNLKNVVLGRSEIVGKPLVNMLIDRGATVTCCNSHIDYMDMKCR